MSKLWSTLVVVSFLLGTLVSAEARRHPHNYQGYHHRPFHYHQRYAAHRSHKRYGGTPWCGIYLSNAVFGHLVPGLAAVVNWLKVGTPVSHPQRDAIVIWHSRGHSHVGRIVGPCHGSQCLVNSGNDGNRVRTRMRSVAGASFRALSGSSYGYL